MLVGLVMVGSEANRLASSPSASFIPFRAFSGRRFSSSDRLSYSLPDSCVVEVWHEVNSRIGIRQITNCLIDRMVFINVGWVIINRNSNNLFLKLQGFLCS